MPLDVCKQLPIIGIGSHHDGKCFSMNLERATLLLALATILLVIVEALRDPVWSWWKRPRLRVSIAMEPPGIHAGVVDKRAPDGKITVQADTYYFTLSVSNVGRSCARDVEVFVHTLSKRSVGDRYTRIGTFLPTNLLWSFRTNRVLESLPPGISRHCTLGHVIDPRHAQSFPDHNHPELLQIVGSDKIAATFCLDLEVTSRKGARFLRPGDYRLELTVAASNARSRGAVVEISHSGDWYPRLDQMVTRGVFVRLTRYWQAPRVRAGWPWAEEE
jgi:hypothetical protein